MPPGAGTVSEQIGQTCCECYNNRYNLDAYSRNQPIEKEWRNNPAILLVRKFTDFAQDKDFHG